MNVYFLLDRSGSMDRLWKEAVGSINAYVENLPVNTNIVLAVFDSQSYDVIRNTTAKEWKNIAPNEATPRAGTPLYDSSVRMMYRALDDNPDKAVFVIMTDGEENQSRHFKQVDVKSLVSRFQSNKWEVIFLGADFDKVGDVAHSYGLDGTKFMNINADSLDGTMRSFAGMTTQYASAASASINITAEDKAKAVGKTV